MNQEMNLVKICDMNKYCDVDRKTLIVLEKNEILVPAFKDEEGYRYYSMRQVYLLHIIGIMMESGISLNQIKEYVCGNALEDIEKSLLEHLSKLQKKIEQLQKMREKDIMRAFA